MTTTLPIAFLAGFISFLSPCVLPLIPGYISYISGMSFDKLVQERKGIVLVKTIFFTLGFSFVFIIFGSTASFVGKFFLNTWHCIVQNGVYLSSCGPFWNPKMVWTDPYIARESVFFSLSGMLNFFSGREKRRSDFSNSIFEWWKWKLGVTRFKYSIEIDNLSCSFRNNPCYFQTITSKIGTNVLNLHNFNLHRPLFSPPDGFPLSVISRNWAIFNIVSCLNCPKNPECKITFPSEFWCNFW